MERHWSRVDHVLPSIGWKKFACKAQAKRDTQRDRNLMIFVQLGMYIEAIFQTMMKLELKVWMRRRSEYPLFGLKESRKQPLFKNQCVDRQTNHVSYITPELLRQRRNTGTLGTQTPELSFDIQFTIWPHSCLETKTASSPKPSRSEIPAESYSLRWHLVHSLDNITKITCAIDARYHEQSLLEHWESKWQVHRGGEWHYWTNGPVQQEVRGPRGTARRYAVDGRDVYCHESRSYCGEGEGETQGQIQKVVPYVVSLFLTEPHTYLHQFIVSIIYYSLRTST